jgi:hypothetical protein
MSISLLPDIDEFNVAEIPVEAVANAPIKPVNEIFINPVQKFAVENYVVLNQIPQNQQQNIDRFLREFKIEIFRILDIICTKLDQNQMNYNFNEPAENYSDNGFDNDFNQPNDYNQLNDYNFDQIIIQANNSVQQNAISNIQINISSSTSSEILETENLLNIRAENHIAQNAVDDNPMPLPHAFDLAEIEEPINQINNQIEQSAFVAIPLPVPRLFTSAEMIEFLANDIFEIASFRKFTFQSISIDLTDTDRLRETLNILTYEKKLSLTGEGVYKFNIQGRNGQYLSHKYILKIITNRIRTKKPFTATLSVLNNAFQNEIRPQHEYWADYINDLVFDQYIVMHHLPNRQDVFSLN